MKFLIEPYIHKRTEDLSFVQLSSEAIQVKDYVVPDEGLFVPLLTTELANNIKTKEEDKVITANGIVRGMVYLLGVDSDFKYRDEYIKFLYAVNSDIEDYINFEAIKFADEGKMIESIIFLKALLLLNDKNIYYIFNYGLTLLKYSSEHLNNKPKVQSVFKKESTICFETILDIDENFSLAYYHLGFLYSDNKQFNKAKLYWERYLKLDTNVDLSNEVNQMLLEIEDQAKYERGYEAVLSGRPQEGLTLLLELEERYSNWWNLLFFIGLAYRQLLKYEDAIGYFDKVLQLEENQLDTIAELGLCYGSIGYHSQSIEYFERALHIGGQNSEILCNLAMVHMEIGNLAKAKEYLDTSLALNNEDEITKACSEQLNALLKNNR
ncbi:tetratricopeptide repeat protein [Alkaliphilus sp. B6464]|uniref:tetratricopeptide repeat protein n=1 Tax=Alkaliphilus sp. B6464 TaxID=2731219 RepID=UPI001BA47482|nr:tetratricopeptide repeat protein [Alkaliphilus sp. B6464]QUH20437.1 tetratricopeptide repeat protein [Alkaliphilus sp. B6464]